METEDQTELQAYDRIWVGMQFTYRREALGLDAQTVAEQAGYSLTQYTLMEEGKRQIKANLLLLFGIASRLLRDSAGTGSQTLL